MAAELALGLVGPAIEVAKLVGRPIVRQVNYLCCFSSNISGLEEEAKKLDDAIAGLEEEVDIARDRRQEKPVAEVKTWLTDSDNLKVEINEILNQSKDVESGCSKLVARFSLSRRAKKTTKRTKLLRDGKKFEVKFQPGSPAARQAVQLRKPYEFESRNKIEEEIMAALRGGEVSMLGIHGMGGLGKTIMAKKLMNRALEKDENDRQLFQEVVIATVSQKVDKSKIQDEIGGQLGLDKLKEEKSESARVDILHLRLTDSKRILLVLDDVWETLALESIGIPRDSEMCTILFTSRNRDILHRLEVKIFGMKELSEPEAFSFLRDAAGTCVDDGELNPIAQDVAKECGGLPINLAAVGAGLRDQRNPAIWKNTLLDLKQSVPDNVDYDKDSYIPLKWSYYYLNKKPAQSLFLLCCLFPKDANIPLEYLTNFCMGLCIFEGIENMEDARNKTFALTQFLKDRTLLLDNDKKDCVRMHDVYHDVCTSIAKEEGCIGKDGCTWISPSHLVGQRNELVFLDNRFDTLGFTFDNAFVEGMRELHVLCIQNYSSFTRLPRPTQSLGKLKTLILDSCPELGTISVVGELVNLEILICRHCELIEKLPSKMKELKSLKVLELTKCSKLQSIGRGIIKSLVSLEELKMHGSFKRWEAENKEERENASIQELEALPNLACLEIDIQDPSLLAEDMPHLSKKIGRLIIRNIFRYIPSGFGKAMRIHLEGETRLGDWIQKQLKDTECLYLSGAGANNVDLAKIHQNIRWLELGRCGSTKNIATTSGGDDATVFPSMEHLRLFSLPKLQEICDGPISSTSFQYLKQLELMDLRALTQIWKSSSVTQNNYVPPHFTSLSSIVIDGCCSLRNLGQLSMAGEDCLPQLRHLHIWHCSKMEQVFLWNDREEAIELHVITKVFPKLIVVILEYLPNLTTFYQGIQGIQFPLLQELKIVECPKMKSIIYGSSSADTDEDCSSHLLCQPQKISFGSSLEVLDINDVGSTSIFALSEAVNLVSLRKLRISYCAEMIKVIEEDEEQQQQRILVFPKLEELELTELPKLVSFCDSKCEVELPLLGEVEIERCPNMENFSVGFVATPSLKIVRIDCEEIEATEDLNVAVQQHYLEEKEALS